MHGEHSFTFLSLIPGLEHAPAHVVHAILVAALLIISMVFARVALASAMSNVESVLVPPAKLTYRNFFEILAEKIYGLVVEIMGEHKGRHFFPLIGTIFCFIFLSNLLGLVPGFLPPTDNLNTTIALGVFVFLYYNFMGFKENGIGYLKHFWGEIWWLGPFLFVLELISHMIRPISLAFRLKWNIAGDHIVLGIFSGLVPYLLPIVFLGLGAFVAFIQTFVFSLLTMVYISMSTEHDH